MRVTFFVDEIKILVFFFLNVRILFSNKDKSNHEFYASAHVGLAWSSIVLKKPSKSASKHVILDTLKKALELLSTDMALINSSQCMLNKVSSSSSHSLSHSDLGKQLNVKTTILGSYLNSVQQAMQTVKKSLRLIDVERVGRDKTGVVVRETFADVDREFKYETSVSWDTSLDETDERDDKPAEKNVVYRLAFNDLTVYSDAGDHDQACKTIDNAVGSSFKTFFGNFDSYSFACCLIPPFSLIIL